MHQISDVWLERQRKRFTRHDASRWWRCNATHYRRFDPRFHRDRSSNDWKAYNPGQPRVPGGSPEGGQWTGGEETPVRLAAAEKGPLGRLGKIGAAAQALRYLIEAFRKEHLLFDFFGEKVGTVAVTSLDDQHLYGFNSGIAEFSGQYTERDKAAADELRDRLIEKYPEVMKTENIGSRPNDALYHAETNLLLRAWRENGETLEGRELVVLVDRMLCRSCDTVLPKVGLELGNPRITFVGPTGFARTMRDGRWLD